MYVGLREFSIIVGHVISCVILDNINLISLRMGIMILGGGAG